MRGSAGQCEVWCRDRDMEGDAEAKEGSSVALYGVGRVLVG